MLRWIGRHRRSAAAAALVSAVSVVLGVLAVAYEGFTSTDVDLHDGGVWVTRTQTQQLGHLNVQAETLDAGLVSPSDDFDVLQDGDDVLLLARDAGTAIVVDPVLVETGAAVQLPAGGTIALGGGTVAVADPASGAVWAMPFEALTGFDPATAEPTLELGADVVVAVSLAGVVHAVSPGSSTQARIALGADGPEVLERSRPELAAMLEPRLSLVGDEAVVHDPSSGALLLPGGPVEAPEGAALQQVGDASDVAVLTTPTALVQQPLDGGEATVQEDRGGAAEAVPPVQLGGCAYAVWPGSAQYVRDCADDARDAEHLVEGLDGSPVVFRVNRGAVVLNQLEEGSSWLLSDRLVLVDNWTDLVPPPSEERSDEEDESTEDRFEDTPPPPSEENSPPVANDDDFGARAGRSTLLPVLWNDSDPDGDVLTASVAGDLPEGVVVAPVEQDSQLQVQLPPDQPAGTIRFEYRIADGRGETDTATVTVEVRDDSTNDVPRSLREATVVVEQGATVEYQVLQDWLDPDGDDLYLVGATSGSGDTIQTDPSGRLVYTATGDAGLQEVEVRVSDGRGEATGRLSVDVRERGEAPPQANADFVATIVGREATIRPLLNDYSPSGDPLRLALVQEQPGVEMRWDGATGVVRIVDAPLGTHYLSYVVAGGGTTSATGRIRVDVREADDEARPVAVRDTALLPLGGEALVDLLQNDVDPAGGVLVVQAITVPGAAPITAELVDRRLVRIRDSRGLEAPMQLQYAVSNGRFTETGTIEVIPVAPPAQPRAPVAVDDVATVRAGDFQTVDVLANDFSPDGAPFTMVRELVSTSFASAEEGIAFVAEGELRVHALEGAPSRATVAYEIEDEQGNRATATATIRIVPRDAEQNAAPSPRSVTARVLAGSTVRIPIPLEGIDGDGDGVELVGYDTAPDQGEIVETGPDHFDFRAYPDAGGTVEFTYRVRDRWGASATATATIGIAQAADVNQTPFAETDLVTARPGRAVAIPVLENDSDPDQDALRLVLDGLDAPPELRAEVDEERGTVDLVTPEDEGVHQLTYVVSDARGLTTVGTVMLTVAEDARLEPPIARDDPVSGAELVLGQPMDVPVLENDLDPDGDPDELAVSIVTGPGTVVDGAVQIVPTEAFQVVAYRVADVDGQVAEAFVSVPPVRDQRPVLSVSEPLQIPSGEERQLRLRDIVAVASGNAPRITSGESVTAVHDDGSGLVVDTETLRFRSSPGYVGPASITFEATDGTSPEDPEGITAVLTLPIEVTPSSVIAPSFAGATLQVVAGEDATRFDLRSATTDPDPGDLEAMAYDGLAGAVPGVQAGLEGSTFVATADRTASPGATGAYSVRVTDPYGNEVTGTLVVEVVATNRPLPVAVPDAAEGDQGQPIAIDVTTNDVNPFARDGVPLRVVAAEVVGGDGRVAHDDRTVTVTSGADFSGTLTVRYTVQDGTELTSRQVTGTATVTVKGRPDAPPRPNVDAVGDAQVTLTWAPPAPNGAPITGYLVRSADGSVSRQCPSTTCVVDGLTNDVTYRFQVVAQNEVGDSDPSDASADARPDRRPEQPSAPTATRGDGSLAIAWPPAVSNGSSVTGYTLQIQPPAPDGTVAIELGAVTAHTWEGLANGTAYSFRLQAHNLAPEPSDVSEASSPVIPAGRPFAVTGASAAVDRSTPGEVQMTVTWEPADGNGAAVDAYTVRSSTGLEQTVTGTTARFARVPLDGSRVTFTVVATNAVGTGPASAATQPITAATAPGAPSGVAIVDGDGQVRVDWTPGSRNGLRADEVSFEVQANGGGVQSFGPGGTYTGLANTGGPYTIEVRAVATVDGQVLRSAWTAAATQARPFGPPPAPAISMTSGVHQVTYHWSPSGTNGRALDRIEWTQYENGQNMQRVSPVQGSQTQELPGGHQAYMTAIAVDVDGNVSERITIGPVAAGYAPPPQPLASVTGGPGTVTFSYAPNGTTDRPLDRLEWILDDGASGWTVVRPAAPGSFSGGREPGNQACIRVRAIDTGGLESEHIVACGYALP